jgi:hypothetical protein
MREVKFSFLGPHSRLWFEVANKYVLMTVSNLFVFILVETARLFVQFTISRIFQIIVCKKTVL